MAKRKKTSNKNSKNKKKESVVHVRLGFEEAVNTKRSLLNIEMWLLKAAKNIEAYKLLRLKELALKETLQNKSKEFRASIENLETVLPEFETPHLKHDSSQPSKTGEIKGKKGSDIEDQLLEIQRRLDALQSQNI